MKTFYTKCVMAVALLAIFQGCSTAPTAKVQKHKIAHEKFGNFDKVYIPNEAQLIAQMISVVQPELEINSRNKIANDIFHAIMKYKVEPQIVVALIDTESNFMYNKVSSTGDLSLGQLNVEVWNAEFTRMKLPPIKRELLVYKDQSYAMEKMAQILSILKTRYAKRDRRWYARYHSNTTKYKTDYLRKIEIRMKLLAQSRIITTNKSIALSTSQISP
ncbi:MAG: transglycosylase SLT domain-containing protein [Bacteriovorax sp.]|nr:transglycosylase SLT domain-containing protein [Bacteriovorax sp.]